MPKPAIATRDDKSVDDLYGALDKDQRDRVIGDGTRPSIVNVRTLDAGAQTALDVQDQVRRLVARAAVRVRGDTRVSYSSLHTFGTRSNPQITHIAGNLHVGDYGHVYGAGVLVIDGDLIVDEDGYLIYDGVVIVRGQAQVKLRSKRPWWWSWFPHWWWSGSRLRGALVLLPTAKGVEKAQLEIRNRVEIHASEQALKLAARAAAHVLPVRIESWWEGRS